MKHLLLISFIVLHTLQPLRVQANDEFGDSWLVPATLLGATAFVFTICELQLQKRNVTQLKAQITQLQANKAEQDKNVTALTTANDEKTQTIASLKDNLVTKEKAVKTLLRFSLLQGSLAKSKQQKIDELQKALATEREAKLDAAYNITKTTQIASMHEDLAAISREIDAALEETPI